MPKLRTARFRTHRERSILHQNPGIRMMSVGRIRLAGVLLALAATASCRVSPLETAPAASGRVLVSATAPQVWQGTEVGLSAMVFDAEGERIASPRVRWTTSDPAVLTVHETEDGAVARGVAPGRAIVVATAEGVQGSLPLEVEFGGEIRLRYSGARTGEFHAAGPGSGNPNPRATRATGVRIPLTEQLTIYGVQAHPDGTADHLQIELSGVTVQGGEWKFPASCGAGERCVGWAELRFNAAVSEDDLPAQTSYSAHAGSLTIVTLVAGRVTARLEGSFCERDITPTSTPCDPLTGQGMLHLEGTLDVLTIR